ncbi:6102_t:CDS:10, partial [Acaulospora morrowiae]
KFIVQRTITTHFQKLKAASLSSFRVKVITTAPGFAQYLTTAKEMSKQTSIGAFFKPFAEENKTKGIVRPINNSQKRTISTVERGNNSQKKGKKLQETPEKSPSVSSEVSPKTSEEKADLTDSSPETSPRLPVLKRHLKRRILFSSDDEEENKKLKLQNDENNSGTLDVDHIAEMEIIDSDNEKEKVAEGSLDSMEVDDGVGQTTNESGDTVTTKKTIGKRQSKGSNKKTITTGKKKSASVQKKSQNKVQETGVEVGDEVVMQKSKSRVITKKQKDQDMNHDKTDDIESENDSEAEEKVKSAIKTSAADLASRSLPKDIGVSWKDGELVPYAALCKTFEKIEATTKRLEIQEHLTSLFVHVIEKSPNNLLFVLYLCLNRVCPEYESLELGVGESLLIKAIAETTGRKTSKVKEELAKWGDLGKVAKDSKTTQPTLVAPKPLTVQAVFDKMKFIAETSGQDSQEKKVREIKLLLTACRDEEPKYLIRSLEGKLRIGLAEQTILISLAQAIILKDPVYQQLPKAKKAEELAEAPNIVKAVYSELPSYDIIVPTLLEYGVKGLAERCKLTPGIPIKPMLAHPTKSITEVLDRVEGHKFTCEFKYDGERGQIHMLEDGMVKIYSRNLEDSSMKFPDIVEKLPKIVKPDTKSFVLDCEVVAWDPNKGCLLPFQVLSTRKRKDVKESDIKVVVCLYAFDLLYLNGESLLRKSLEERRECLYEAFQEVEGNFAFASYMNATSTDEIQTFLDDSVKNSCEGLMVKILDGQQSTYEPSKRSRNWLKLKKDYLSGIGDSLDLVVIGAYLGRGKRMNVYGAFLLACYDPNEEQYQTICKIGTGFSEASLENHFKFLKEQEISEPKSYYDYDRNTKPDVWFEPVQVWEIKAADLSISPVYKAAFGLVDSAKGISLRFPRFVQVREDKKSEDATTSEQVADMYRQQFNNK